MDAKKVQKAQEASVRSRNPDGGLDSDKAIEPMTTHDEVQKAVLILRKYTKYLDDPLTRKLEMMLGLFRQQMHATAIQNTKDIKLTSYFTSKE
ncbi:hypothetical protein OG21DRAFT_1425418 [Imleria badia]|nr:hypothetical protein OG21DRAFT_1425418 [Imleria badia]